MPPKPSFVVPPITARPVPLTNLLAASLRRPGGRRIMSALSLLLLVTGVGLFAYPFYTNIQQHRKQASLGKVFASPTFVKTYKTGTFKIGDAVTKLEIPKIGLHVYVVEGTTEGALEAGVGHYVGTPLPGQAGNVAIAGHRTTYGRPFNRLDEVHPGDVVKLTIPGYQYTYVAVPDSEWGPKNPHPVAPEDTSVLDQPKDPSDHLLTLTTCNPKGSAAQRLILRLRLDPTKTKILPLPKGSTEVPDTSGASPSP